MPLFSGFGPDAIMSRLESSAAKAVLTVAVTSRGGKQYAMADVAMKAVAGLACPPQVVVIRTAAAGPVPAGATELDPGTAVAGPLPATAVPAEHPLLLAYTSGTTGKPKGAVLGHAGMLAGVGRDAHFHMDVKPSDVLLWSTDMGWIMGPWAIIATGLPGATLALYEGGASYPDPDRLWRVVENLEVSILGVSPSLIRGLAAHDSTPERHDLSRLRILGSTGEPWNAEAWWWLLRRVGRSRAPIINISGGTEVGGALLAPLPVCPLKPSTVGGPALGMDVGVVDGNGAPLAEGIGELAVFQPWPSMTRGLWQDRELFLDSYWSRVPGVWMHGDWVSRDEAGFWFVHGRSDDALNVGGRRIGPSEVERVLLRDDLVNAAAAVALPHKTNGQSIWCFVTCAEPGAVSGAELVARLSDAVAAQLGKPFRPERIVIVADLPMTQSSKTARRLVRQVALDEPVGDLSGIANPQAIDDIRHALAQHQAIGAQP
jgi:acetyl-CoA synthetase